MSRGRPWIWCIKVTNDLPHNPLLRFTSYIVIDSRGKNRNQREQSDASQAGGAPHTSLFEETRSKGRTSSIKSRKLTPAQLRELEEQKEKDVVRGYQRVEELWPKMLDKTGTETDRSREEAEREWIFEAEKLVEMFRETRMLFLSIRVSLLDEIYNFGTASATF